MWWPEDIVADSDKTSLINSVVSLSDSQFPINIVAVKNDHDFLEKENKSLTKQYVEFPQSDKQKGKELEYIYRFADPKRSDRRRFDYGELI